MSRLWLGQEGLTVCLLTKTSSKDSRSAGCWMVQSQPQATPWQSRNSSRVTSATQMRLIDSPLLGDLPKCWFPEAPDGHPLPSAFQSFKNQTARCCQVRSGSDAALHPAATKRKNPHRLWDLLHVAEVAELVAAPYQTTHLAVS